VQARQDQENHVIGKEADAVRSAGATPPALFTLLQQRPLMELLYTSHANTNFLASLMELLYTSHACTPTSRSIALKKKKKIPD
jgi:hypothetical protein